MPHADLVFTGGPVLTMDPARTRASSLAVKGSGSPPSAMTRCGS